MMDSPLKEVSANLRDMKLGASPSKGGALKAGAGRLGLSRKDRMDSVPSSSADLKVGITRDWQGPDKALKPKVAASISVSIWSSMASLVKSEADLTICHLYLLLILASGLYCRGYH